MGTMRKARPEKRKQRLDVHLDPPLLAWLRLESDRRGAPLAELVRDAVRRLMDAPSA